MKAEFTAIVDKSPEGGYWAICREVPGANGQGDSIVEAKDNLRQAIELILEDHREDIPGAPASRRSGFPVVPRMAAAILTTPSIPRARKPKSQIQNGTARA